MNKSKKNILLFKIMGKLGMAAMIFVMLGVVMSLYIPFVGTVLKWGLPICAFAIAVIMVWSRESLQYFKLMSRLGQLLWWAALILNMVMVANALVDLHVILK